MEGGLSDIEAEVFYQASEDVEVKGDLNPSFATFHYSMQFI